MSLFRRLKIAEDKVERARKVERIRWYARRDTTKGIDRWYNAAMRLQTRVDTMNRLSAEFDPQVASDSLRKRIAEFMDA